MKRVKCLNLLIILALYWEYNKIQYTKLYGKKLKSCANKLCIALYIYTIICILDSRFQTEAVPEIVMRESGSTVFLFFAHNYFSKPNIELFPMRCIVNYTTLFLNKKSTIGL